MTQPLGKQGESVENIEKHGKTGIIMEKQGESEENREKHGKPGENISLYYFGGARSKGFATLRNVSKLQFFDKIGQARSVGFRLYSAI